MIEPTEDNVLGNDIAAVPTEPAADIVANAAEELTKRAQAAFQTLTNRGRKPMADPFQLAVLAAAIQTLLVQKGICTQSEFDHAVLASQAELLEAMVQSTAIPNILVPGSIVPFPTKN